MAFFAKREDVQHGLPMPPEEEASASFADKMLQRTLGLTFQQLQQFGQEAQHVAQTAAALMQSYDNKLGAILARLDVIESEMAELVEEIRSTKGKRDARQH